MRDLIQRRWQELEPLLDEVLAMNAGQREAWFSSWSGDAALAEALRLLIVGSEVTGRFDVAHQSLHLDPTMHFVGREIGGFRIQRRLGDGGQATVFLAVRETVDYVQRVAIKLLHHGTWDAVQLQLFRREQKILARLEHAGIARLIDGGVDESGVAYLVMEFVDGVPLTQYCDREQLNIEQRLHLLSAVCEAVDYAHRNLVVHRDLKPSNILVGQDGKVKLLDFGIAKLLDEKSPQTRTETRHLTPAYAAPEQHTGASVSTATDVYALGVMMHELLLGSLPRIGADQPLELPSKRAATVDLDEARRRCTRPVSLARRLRGDLDGIMTKALRHDPSLRYSSASELERDIHRHLHGLPVGARPDSLGYRVVKWVTRHRELSATLAISVMALVTAAVFSLQQAHLARNEAKNAAIEASRANAVKSFLFSLFAAAEPGSERPIETTEALLSVGRSEAEKAFSENPAILVEVLTTLGDLERQRGNLKSAREPIESALARARFALGPGDPRSLSAATALAKLDEVSGAHRNGVTQLRAAIAEYAHAGGPANAEFYLARIELSVLLARSGDLAAAVSHARSNRDEILLALPQEHGLQSSAELALGDALVASGQFAEAIPAITESLSLARTLFGDQHVEVAERLVMLADAYRQLGRLTEAETALREVLAIQQVAYSKPNPRMGTTLNDLGLNLYLQRRIDEAEPMFTQALAIYRDIYPSDHPEIAITLGNLAGVRLSQQRFDEAEALQRQQLEMTIRTRGIDHPTLGRVHRNLGFTLLKRGDHARSRDEFLGALKIDEAASGKSSPAVAYDRLGLAELAVLTGDANDAEAEYGRALAIFRDTVAAGHTSLTRAAFELAKLQQQRGAASLALASFREAFASARAASPINEEELIRTAQALVSAERADGDASSAGRIAAEVRARLPPDAKLPSEWKLQEPNH